MKRCFLILLFLLPVLLLYTFCGHQIQQASDISEDPLVSAYYASGATAAAAEVYLWSILDAGYNNAEVRQKLIHNLSREFHIQQDVLPEKGNHNTFITEVEGVDKHQRKISIRCQYASDGTETGSIYVNIKCGTDVEAIQRLRENGRRILTAYGLQPRVYCNIIGFFNKNMKIPQMQKSAIRIISMVRARKVEEMKDNGLISLSAYSPVISDHVQVNGKKVNLNIALRYNSLENRTYIWLGTPVITIEY